MGDSNPAGEDLADVVQPVPGHIVPEHIKANPEALNLYKSEWRRAQLMRALDERLIPRVKRIAFPPEAAPHGVAGQPPPSYITPPKARQRPPQTSSISISSQTALTNNNASRVEVKDDSVIGVGRYIPGRPVDFTEQGMNTPQQDYTLLHATRQKTGSCAPYQDWKSTAQGGRRSKSLARVALKEDSTTDAPKTSSYQMPSDEYQQAADDVFKAAGRALSAPYIIDLGAMGGKPGISTCTSDHNVFASKPIGKNLDSFNSSKPSPKELFEATARLAAGSQLSPPTKEDFEAAKERAVATCTQHLRSTADALRNYNVLHPHYRQPSAISSIATTYSRPPKAPHVTDSTFASPSERIAANYSLKAWGLSARTLQKLSASGVQKSSEAVHNQLDIASLSTASKRIPFMPLELFDEEGLEVKTPQQWLESDGPEGKVMASTGWLNLNTQQYEQRPVRVLSYSSIERTYLVEFECSGVRKQVKRLHLKFDSEDGALFEARVAAAKQRRAAAEAELRWRFTVDAMDAEEVMNVYDFGSKVAAVRQECPSVTEPVYKRKREELAEDFHENYKLAVRISQFEYHRLNPTVEQQLQVLGLPRPKVSPAAPELGVCRVTSGSEAPLLQYPEALSWAGENLMSSSPVLSHALQMIRDTFLKARAQLMYAMHPYTPDFLLFRPDSTYTEEDAGQLPWMLKQLEAVLSSHSAQVASYLQSLAPEVLNICCGEDVRTELSGKETAALMPGDSMDEALLGLLTRCSLNLQAVCREMLLESVDVFASHIESFCPQLHEEKCTDEVRVCLTKLTELPILQCSVNEHWGIEPLLKIDLEYSDGRVVCRPSLEETSNVIISQFDEMANQLMEVQDDCLGAVKNSLTAPAVTLDGWKSEPQFQHCRERVRTAVYAALEAVRTVQDTYSNMVADLNITVDELLTQFDGASLEQYAERLDFYKQQINSVNNNTSTQVYTGLILVNAGPMKYTLVHRISGFVSAMLNQVANQQEASNKDIIAVFQRQQETVLRVSQSTEENLQVSKDIVAAETKLVELQEVITSNKGVDSFLENYRWDVSAAAIDTRAEAYGWPATMSEVLEQAAQKASLEYTQLQRKLKADTIKLQEDIEECSKQVSSFASLNDVNEQVEYAAQGQALWAQLEAAMDQAAYINSEEHLFDLQKSEWPRIAQLQKELQPYLDLWSIVSEFNIKYDDWMYGSFTKLDAELIDECINEWFKKMLKLARSLPREDLRGVADTLRAKLEEFKGYLGIISCICNPGMRGRHWQAISKAADFKVAPSEEESLGNLLQHNLHKYEKELQDISDSATREHALEKQLDNMQAAWGGVAFEVAPWKNTGGYILKGGSVDEAQMLLDDHAIKSQAMMSSPFAKPFHDQISMWSTKLNKMQSIFDEWLTCQVKWMYLGPVYGSEEIAKQMPKERKEFGIADGKYRRIMLATISNPDVQAICGVDGLLEDLIDANKAFSTIEKSLSRFLDTIKGAFARFWFLSNDELLEILSETKIVTNVQPFVKKCFEAVQSLTFDSNLMITGCTSIEGEDIKYDTPIDPNGETNGVEKWLLQTEQVMMGSLHTITKTSVIDYATAKREDWLLKWPGQVVLAVSQIYWTKAVDEALSSAGTEGLQKFAQECSDTLRSEVELVRGELTKLQRATLGALVVIDVHARDVLAEMARDGVCSETDFAWQAQLRYYWETPSGAPRDTVIVRMLNAVANYGYEYLGNSSRLVITPLTDRCYRTLLGAHHLNMGGAPAGPAGTGKTETTKDLSKAVAIQCVVFNCSDQLDYVAMGKFFKGLASSGAWACFDEFNRIELEVLSVVAQQVLTIQRAKQAGQQQFVFEGVELPIIHTCNVFITMNPGYAGRSELPDNLKALFRDVAMMVPDYAMISEIILYSCGYFEARVLGVKLVQTYRLCSEQLSKQEHYDYGMRAVVAVLRAAGNLKRKFPNEQEDVLMLRAIKDVNEPKFLDQDVPLFTGILSDLFPGISLPDLDYTDMIAAIKENCAKMNLQPLDTFIMKIIQLYEMIVVRHGLMMVGWSFGMKTAAIRVLARALGDLHAKGLAGEFNVKTWTLNPKSVTMGQLYGEDDPVSKEWTDGVLAVAFRNAARDTSEDRKWIVLDGPVDAIWIENMNTVLDDNKKLCLNSGEIVAMQGLMNMIFEVQDLAVASPATVSRCGMVYVQPSLLGWKPLLQSWLDRRPAGYSEQHKDMISALCNWLLPPCLRLATKFLTQPVKLQEQILVVTLLNLLEAQLQPVLGEDGKSSGMKPSDVDAAVQNMFLFSLVWSVGGSLSDASRSEFDQQLRLYLDQRYDDRVSLVIAHEGVKLSKPIPKEGSVFGYVYVLQSNSWKEWLDTVPAQKLDEGMEFQNITVQTEDVVRYTYLIDTYTRNHNPVLLVGPTGTGKSVYMKDYLMHQMDKLAWTAMIFGFSAQTSVNMTQDIIDGKLDKRRKGEFGPPVGKRCVIFVDDLNMPQVETYGAQPPIELLRQYMDHSGWYDRKLLSFRQLVDIQFCAAMGPPGGGRNNVTNRYIRHFNTISMTEFQESSKKMIFTTLAEWWLSKSKYGDDLMRMGPKLASASLEVYTSALKELLPTPTRSHYTFNLRDLSNLFQGMCLAGSTLQSVDDLVRLWTHESLRVFSDRLIDDGDREWFAGALAQASETHFSIKWKKVLSRLANTDGEIKATELRSLLFGDFMIPGADPPLYIELKEPSELSRVVTEYLAEYNANTKAPMNLVLFTFALEHVARICRILRQPGGHALLVGLGGSGRQSLTRLAAFICDYKVMSVELTSTYSRNDWKDDLKAVLKAAGEKGVPTVFLFSDTQIKEESMIEDLSNLLNTGEVPNLFDASDQVTIGEGVSAKAKKVGMDGSRADLFNFFISQVRKYLHICLAFSPIGDAFRTRLRMFPALVTNTTINWFTAWPNDALETTADEFLADVDMSDELRKKAGAMCMQFHSGVRDLTTRYALEAKRHFYITPTSYLQLLNAYKALYAKKNFEVSCAKRRYENGLEKLLFTEDQVHTMKQELEVLKPQLVQASEDTDALLVNVEKETVEADKVKAVVSVDEAKAKEEARKVTAIKEECEGDLAEAMPALQAAVKALDTLTKNDITEVKGMKSPPAAVKMVLEAVCIIKGLKPTKVKDADSGKMVMDYWETAKKMMADSYFLESLKTFDKDNIDPEIIQKLQPIITKDEFEPKKVLKVSKAAFGLASWVRAMDTYDRVAKVVGPKKKALGEAEAELEVVMSALKIKQDELKEVVDKLNMLDEQLSAAKTKKANLEAEFKLCSEKLDRAGKLIGGLGGEKVRWTESAASLEKQLVALCGDMLLSAAYIAYLGPFTMAYRNDALASWIQSCKEASIPSADVYSFSAALGDPVLIRQWNIWGLPKDDYSCSNGIIMSNSSRWPLCIDPQGQTNKWIRTMHEKDQIVIVKMSDKNYLRRMETAIQLGQPVLMENVEESLDAALEPVLLKQTFKSAGSLMIKLGDSSVEWSPHFKFYMTTKLRNPHYPPELCTKVALLNFMITPEGLEDQLLGIVVAQERPDLEKQKNQLIIQSAENKRKLKEVEDQILQVLSDSKGNILEDEGAVNILQESKVVSDDIQRKQQAAEKTEKAIDDTRVSYQPIAAHTSVLFFCVVDMAAIDPMYQYSLVYFISLFLRSIEAAPRSKDVPTRLQSLKDHFTFFLYVNVCRSLFERHKLLFAFNLSTKLALAQYEISPVHLNFLLTGGIAMENPHANPLDGSLSDKGWGELCRLNDLGGSFEGLRDDLTGNPAAWLEFVSCKDPQDTPLPGDWNSTLTPFEKLIALRCLRPDKMVPAIHNYIMNDMGKRYVEPQTFRLEPIFADSQASVPLIFVLSQGSDPMADLLMFAEEKCKRVEAVSLGQGQGPVAESWIKEAISQGFWVVLQNCHLAKTFLPRLEQLCEKDLTSPDVHPQFRLWLTSYPSPIFPISILENGLKITNEAPSGMRAGLERIYKADPVNDMKFFEGCSKELEFKAMLFSLSFFHCVLVGRKNYGPVGWNIPYQFNENDLRISLRQLRMFLDEYEEVPMDMLTYTCGECNYGGKVTDGKDRRTLNTLLSDFYNEHVLEGSYTLSPSGLYTIPATGGYDSYLEYMASLPQLESPEVFGLHDNATITMDLKQTQDLLDTLLLTQPRNTGGGAGSSGESPDDVIFNTASDILDKIPKEFDIEAAQRRFPVLYTECMNTVLCQELGRVNVLLQQITSSLRELKRAVKGLVLLSAQLEKIGDCLTVGKVPDHWLAKSFPSLKPLGPYIKEVLDRCAFFQSWVDNGPPTVFWLPGFFFTQAFLTGVKQNFARKYTIPIDIVDFDFTFKDQEGDCQEAPEDGCYCYGMFFEAADWDYDKHELCESQPKILFAPVPKIHLVPQKIEEMEEYPHYNCPMYKTSERRGILSTTGHSTNFVMDIKVPTSLKESHWIKRGTAMLTSLDD